MPSKIKCVLFNLGEAIDRQNYEDLVTLKDRGEVQFIEQEKSWGKRAEDALYVMVVYKEREEY